MSLFHHMILCKQKGPSLNDVAHLGKGVHRFMTMGESGMGCLKM